MLKCRDCIYWEYIEQWQGNCKLHPWTKPKWSQDASAYNCEDYKEKAREYESIKH